MEIQKKFFNKWNFPQCLGALDGKHVAIHCPRNGGSRYFNYLRFHSIVLFALVDADYKFVYFEVGAPGRTGDATIWNVSPLKQQLQDNTLHAPPSLATPDTNRAIPSLIVADSAFALGSTVMKPYPERNITWQERTFNYRLSRARRIVENAFGILACRFAVYQSAMKVDPKRVQVFILATLALHNFLRNSKDQQYCGASAVDAERGDEHAVVPGAWRENRNAHLAGFQVIAGGARDMQHMNGRLVRDALKDYFVGPGAVPWQSANM